MVFLHEVRLFQYTTEGISMSVAHGETVMSNISAFRSECDMSTETSHARNFRPLLTYLY